MVSAVFLTGILANVRSKTIRAADWMLIGRFKSEDVRKQCEAAETGESFRFVHAFVRLMLVMSDQNERLRAPRKSEGCLTPMAIF